VQSGGSVQVMGGVSTGCVSIEGSGVLEGEGVGI